MDLQPTSGTPPCPRCPALPVSALWPWAPLGPLWAPVEQRVALSTPGRLDPGLAEPMGGWWALRATSVSVTTGCRHAHDAGTQREGGARTDGGRPGRSLPADPAASPATAGGLVSGPSLTSLTGVTALCVVVKLPT